MLISLQDNRTEPPGRQQLGGADHPRSEVHRRLQADDADQQQLQVRQECQEGSQPNSQE